MMEKKTDRNTCIFQILHNLEKKGEGVLNFSKFLLLILSDFPLLRYVKNILCEE